MGTPDPAVAPLLRTLYSTPIPSCPFPLLRPTPRGAGRAADRAPARGRA